MSVLYVEFLDEFNESKAATTLVQSVCVGMILCSGTHCFNMSSLDLLIAYPSVKKYEFHTWEISDQVL